MGNSDTKLKRITLKPDQIHKVTVKQVVIKNKMTGTKDSHVFGAIDFCDDLPEGSKIVTRIKDAGEGSITLFCHRERIVGIIDDSDFYPSKYMKAGKNKWVADIDKYKKN